MTTPTFADLNHFYLLNRGWDKKPQHKGIALLNMVVRIKDIKENIAIRYKTVLVNKKTGKMDVEHYPNYTRISRAKDIAAMGKAPSKDIEIITIHDDDPLREDLVYFENSAASSYDPSRLSNLGVDTTGLAVRFVELDALKPSKKGKGKPTPEKTGRDEAPAGFVPDQAVESTLQTLKEYRDYADDSLLGEWNNSFIHEVIKAFEFHIKKQDETIAHIFKIDSPESPVAVCFSMIPLEKPDDWWSERVVDHLSKKNLKWGIVTNGHKWHIYCKDGDERFKKQLEIDMEYIFKNEDLFGFKKFYDFMKGEGT